MTNSSTFFLALSLALLLVPATSPAQAVDPNVTKKAVGLFDEAVKEMEEKNYTSACPKLELVTQMLPDGIGAKEQLALCYEESDRLASASVQYGKAEELALSTGQKKRAAEAAANAAKLQPRLATLKLNVPDVVRKLAGLAVALDGIPFKEAQWGTAAPVDAGEHVFEVSAPGYRARSIRVPVMEDGTHKEAEVPMLEAIVAAPRPAPSGTAPHPAPSVVPVDDHPVAPRSWQRPLGIAFVAAGAAGLGAMGLLAGLAVGKKNASNEDGHCDAMIYCDEIGLDLRRQAVGMGNAATAALIAGGVLAGGGLVLLVTAPSPKKGLPKTGYLGLVIEITPGRIGVQGGW